MNADYPFMIPRVVGLAGGMVTLRDREDGTFPVKKDATGREYCVVEQSSSFERLFHRKPAKFRAYPFKDEGTPAIKPDVPEQLEMF